MTTLVQVRENTMQTRILALIALVGLAISIATLAPAVGGTGGCCSCSCPPVGGAAGFDTCNDVAFGECDSLCDGMNCTFSFFQNGTMCSDPALAATCGEAGATMAPAASTTGLAALVALLAGFGAFYLRRRSA